MPELPQWLYELDDKHKQVLVSKLADSIDNYTRRELLKDLGIVGVGAGAMMAGGSSVVGNARADASTSDDDGDIGTPDNRVDVFADGIDSNSVDTDEINDGGPLSDGDGTERQIWIIENGADNPSDADDEDIILEEES